MEIVARKGAAGATLAEIGVAAGFSRGLPAERFGTKRALLEALVDFMERWFLERVPAVIAGRRGLAAVLARIEAHMDGAIASPVATAALYSLFVESIAAIPELRPRSLALSGTFQTGFVVHLEEAKALGEVAADLDTVLMAAVIVGAIRGAVIQSLMDGGVTRLEAVKPKLVAMVAATLRDVRAAEKMKTKKHREQAT